MRASRAGQVTSAADAPHVPSFPRPRDRARGPWRLSWHRARTVHPWCPHGPARL